jgi:hypothetical protein
LICTGTAPDEDQEVQAQILLFGREKNIIIC